MEKTCLSSPILVPPEQTVALASGLWGSVLRVNMIAKVSRAKDGASWPSQEEALEVLKIEQKIYQALGDHPRIARYLGVGTVGANQSDGQFALLFQYYAAGSLLDFFNSPASVDVRNSRAHQLRWAAQILDGLRHIHSRNVVHGDMAIHNLLVDDKLDLVINDFGGSSIDGAEMRVECSPRYHRAHSWRFPIAGVDDEAETWKIPTRVTDTHALGTVLYEVFTGAQLYKGESYDEIRRRATRKERPDLSLIDLLEIRHVIRDCWAERYDSVEQIIEDLQPIWKSGK